MFSAVFSYWGNLFLQFIFMILTVINFSIIVMLVTVQDIPHNLFGWMMCYAALVILV